MSSFVGVIIYPFSFLTIRKRNKFCVGGFAGRFDDSTAVFYRFLSTKNNIEVVWISRTKIEADILKNQGVDAYYRYSLVGLYHLLSAKFYVYGCYISDLCVWTSGRAIKVNLWHGTPLKEIEFGITSGKLSKIYNKGWSFEKIKRVVTSPDFLITPNYTSTISRFYKLVFEKSFKMNDGVLICGTPKFDQLLYQFNKEKQRKNTIKILYAPTWRSGNPYFIDHCIQQLSKLDEFCQNLKLELNLRLHPASKTRIDFSRFTSIKLEKQSLTSIDSVVSSDIIITDYSSICFDGILTCVPVIYFAFDLNEYELEDRKFIIDYKKFANDTGTFIQFESELISAIEASLNLSKHDLEQIKLRTFPEFNLWSERSCELIFNEIYSLKNENKIQ
nr:CDP-glycerol glycerophosphotransferase family protein [Vibrio vulnificus]